MAPLTSAALVVLIACSWIFVLCQEPQELKETVTAGEDATLQCRGQRGANIEVIKWIRPDLESDGYVFVHRDGPSNENDQHPSYRGRVELRDPERKDGDASVILKNVNFNDAGTYECRVREKNQTGKVKLITIINMTVTKPGHTDERKEGGDKERNVGLIVSLIVFAVLLVAVAVAVAVVMIFKKRSRNTADTGEEGHPLNPRPSDPGHTGAHKERGDKEGGD